MGLFFWVFFSLTICFGFVVFVGAPYLPTHKKQTVDLLNYLKTRKGQTFYELGCGDGRVLILAGKKDLKVVGYEINPVLYFIAKIRTLKYENIEVKFGNFWQVDLSEADYVYVFLLDRFMERLDAKLSKELSAGSFLLSYSFKLPMKKLDKELGGFYIYKY